MGNSTLLYWLTRLDGIHEFSCFIAFMATIGALGCIGTTSFYRAICNEDASYNTEANQRNYDYWMHEWRWLRKGVYVLCIVSICVTLFLPTKNEAIIIVTGGKAMDWAQQDTSLAKIPGQTTKIITDYLDKTLKSVEEKKK